MHYNSFLSFAHLPSPDIYVEGLKLHTKCMSTTDAGKFYHIWQNWFKMNYRNYSFPIRKYLIALPRNKNQTSSRHYTACNSGILHRITVYTQFYINPRNLKLDKTAANIFSWLNNVAKSLEIKNKYHWAARHLNKTFGRQSSTNMIQTHGHTTQILYQFPLQELVTSIFLTETSGHLRGQTDPRKKDAN